MVSSTKMGVATAGGSPSVCRETEVVSRRVAESGLRAGREESRPVSRGAAVLRRTPYAEGSLTTIKMHTKGVGVAASFRREGRGVCLVAAKKMAPCPTI